MPRINPFSRESVFVPKANDAANSGKWKERAKKTENEAKARGTWHVGDRLWVNWPCERAGFEATVLHVRRCPLFGVFLCVMPEVRVDRLFPHGWVGVTLDSTAPPPRRKPHATGP